MECMDAQNQKFAEFYNTAHSLQMDVIVADLDGGSIRVPESLTLSLLPDPFWSQTHAALSKVCWSFCGHIPQ